MTLQLLKRPLHRDSIQVENENTKLRKIILSAIEKISELTRERSILREKADLAMRQLVRIDQGEVGGSVQLAKEVSETLTELRRDEEER